MEATGNALEHGDSKDYYYYKALSIKQCCGEPSAPAAEIIPVNSVHPTATSTDSRASEEAEMLPKKENRSRLSSDLQGLKQILSGPTAVLLVFVPLGILAGLRKWGDIWEFSLNFIAIIPLAAVLGAATESLAGHTGQTIGGLLNASFGNAVEMMVTINAIKAGMIAVVQGSLLGSILSNLLLVLGMAFVAAGIKHKECSFNATSASISMTCLTLGSIALAMPTLFNQTPRVTHADTLMVSRISSGVIGIVYMLFLVFQLYTHADLFGGEEDEEPAMSVISSALLLFAATAVVAYCSEFLVNSIEGVSEEYGLPKEFIGVILLPIVGNAAEHFTAVTMAAKGKLDLTLGVAVGSSCQIVLLVVPFAVITGWIYDVPMSLDFNIFHCTVLVLAVFATQGVVQDGSCN